MTLAELIQRIEQLNDRHAIYATPRWRTNSDVAVSAEPQDGSLPESAAGKTYLMTIRQAKRVIAARRALRPDCALSADELAGAVIYYAVYDENEPIASLESIEFKLPVAV